jgi:LAO/AO transport system kinase
MSSSLLPLLRGLLEGNRSSLARAITLIESSRTDHRQEAAKLLDALLQERSKRESVLDKTMSNNPKRRLPSLRIGVAGPPGAGKSSLIETIGMHVLNTSSGDCSSTTNTTSETILNRPYPRSKVAVVAVDPSSTRTGGSILGDKTRMDSLSKDPNAYVRASPTRGALGGLAQHSNDVILLCEGAGFSTVFVETVGLGQSEVAIDECVDMLWLVVPPGGGDELQGVKKGIVELADMIVVNKADGDLLPSAKKGAAEYIRALQLVRPKHIGSSWRPPVLLCSAHTGFGISDVWQKALEFEEQNVNSLLHRRGKQASQWMWAGFEALLIESARERRGEVGRMARALEDRLARGLSSPRKGAEDLLAAFFREERTRL